MKPQDQGEAPRIDHADAAAADRPPRPGAKDRPGFDLGGAVHPTYGGSEGLTDPLGVIPIGDTDVARAAGLTPSSVPEADDPLEEDSSVGHPS